MVELYLLAASSRPAALLPLKPAHLSIPQSFLKSVVVKFPKCCRVEGGEVEGGSRKKRKSRSRAWEMASRLPNSCINLQKVIHHHAIKGIGGTTHKMLASRVLRASARTALFNGGRCFSTTSSRFENRSYIPMPFITETVVSFLYVPRYPIHANDTREEDGAHVKPPSKAQLTHY